MKQESIDKLWEDVQFFCHRNQDLLVSNFNPYSYALKNWKMKNTVIDGNIYEEGSELCLRMVNTYRLELEGISQAFIQKMSVIEKIQNTLSFAETTVMKTVERFVFDKSSLYELYQKNLTDQKFIKLLNKVEKLVNAPSTIDQMVAKGNVYNAVAHLCQSISDYKQNKFEDISSLSGIGKQLDLSRQQLINTVTESLIWQLFNDTPPQGMSFFPFDTPSDNIEIDNKTMGFLFSSIVSLELQASFVQTIRDQLPDRIAKIIIECSNETKVKKKIRFVLKNDPFSDFVFISQNFSSRLPVISFTNKLLCRFYLLLNRCRFIDNFLSETPGLMIIQYVWRKINECMNSILRSLSTTKGKKEIIKDPVLSFSFQQVQSSTEETAFISLIENLDIIPSIPFSLSVIPLYGVFRKMANSNLNLNQTNTPYEDEIRDKIAIIIHEHTKQLLMKPMDSRFVMTDLSSMPLMSNIPQFLEISKVLFNTVPLFPFLSDILTASVISILSYFNNDCESRLQTIQRVEQEHHVFSLSILNQVLPYYLNAPIFTKLVLNNDDSELTESEISDIIVKEEYFDNIHLPNGIITYEQTVASISQLTMVASIIESLSVIRYHIYKWMKDISLAESSLESIHQHAILIDTTIAQCIVFLRLEMRSHCYSEIVTNLINADYKREIQPYESEQFIKSYTNRFSSVYEKLSHCLTKGKLQFVFIGIPTLVYNIHIKYMPKIKVINEKGSITLFFNLEYLKNAFNKLPYQDKTSLQKAQWFAHNLHLSSDIFLIELKKYAQMFKLTEIKPFFEMEQKKNEKSSIILKDLLELFGENFT